MSLKLPTKGMNVPRPIKEIYDITYEVDCEWMYQVDSELSFKDAMKNIIRTINGKRDDLLNDGRSPCLMDLVVVCLLYTSDAADE